VPEQGVNQPNKGKSRKSQWAWREHHQHQGMVPMFMHMIYEPQAHDDIVAFSHKYIHPRFIYFESIDVDQPTKLAPFFPVKKTYLCRETKIYLLRVVCLYGVPKMIVPYQGLQFTARFWKLSMVPWTLL
jgi:hypothetical protein